MPIWSFGRSRAVAEAEQLLATVVAMSRRARFFGENRVPDTLEGRFEVLTLHAALALIRLRMDPAAADVAQAFTDRLFRHLDAGLREAGVGDLTVPKRMRGMAGSFYGRLEAYAHAIESGDGAALSAAVARNVLGSDEGSFAAQLARYVADAARLQNAAPLTALFDPAGWPALEI
jgi:cytochrome b pre-mRNA-processing protein 3